MLLDIIRKTPGTTDAKFSIDDPRQEVQIKLDRAKMAKMGLSSSDVGSALRVALAGNDDSKYTEGNAGSGAELKNGMAWVIIGGLSSSMILTLIVVPIVYYLFDKMTVRFRHFRKN